LNGANGTTGGATGGFHTHQQTLAHHATSSGGGKCGHLESWSVTESRSFNLFMLLRSRFILYHYYLC